MQVTKNRFSRTANYRSIIHGVLVLAISLPLLSCNDGTNQDSDRGDDLRTIGILKFVRHPALDDTEQGLMDRINSSELSDSLEIRFVRNVADANAQRASSIAELMTINEVDVIVAIATPAAQAVANIPSEIPLVYGAVSDPEGAGIIPSERATGIKNVGPSIVQSALAHINQWFPKARTLGTIYNPSEQNSVYVQGILSSLADSVGLELIQLPVQQPSELPAAMESLSQRADVIYSANDNTFNSAISAAVEISIETGTPLILGDISTLEAGATAAIGLDYYDMGSDVGDIVLRILGGESVSDIAPSGPPRASFWINTSATDLLQIDIPDSVLSLADSTVQY